jgi:hypothetical protein
MCCGNAENPIVFLAETGKKWYNIQLCGTSFTVRKSPEKLLKKYEIFC